MFMKATVFVVGFSALLLGCGMESAGSDENQEIVDNLLLAGFPAEEISVYEGVVYVGGDAAVSLAASREMLQDGDSTKEHYRTTNLVVAPSDPTVICIDGTTFAGDFGIALDRAILNYNSVSAGGGFKLNFRRVSGGPDAGCFHFISARLALGVVGGSAGFPSGGSPFAEINIGTGLIGYSVDVIEHVITHELGHTIGLRHSDWFDRSISCGEAGFEDISPPGALYIPGTPVGATVGGSIMNACFRSTETGEFTDSDRTALRNLY